MAENKVKLTILKGRENGSKYVSFGVPWAKFALAKNALARFALAKECSFTLKDSRNRNIEMQSSVNAYWPDGSVKWTLHSANLTDAEKGEFWLSAEQSPQENKQYFIATQDEEGIYIDTAVMQASLSLKGKTIINEIVQEGKIICTGAVLSAMLEQREALASKVIPALGEIESAIIEENGPVKCTVKFTGKHVSKEGRSFFPFTLRLSFFKGNPDIKITHTFFYDADASVDFLKGIGMQFSVPMHGELYNRHVKLLGDNGYFHEALQLLISWRPPLDPNIYKGQIEGEEVYADASTDAGLIFGKAVKDMTIWDNYKLHQDSSEHFIIQKRTQSYDCAYIDCAHGSRSNGTAYVASMDQGSTQGFMLGIRDFWQKYPSAIWAEKLSSDTATLTAWLWSPDAQAADLRHYDTVAHASAYYEGFDELRSSPFGIANTNELLIRGYTGRIAGEEEINHFTESLQKPLVLTPSPEYMHEVKAFGTWSLPHTKTKEGLWFEEQLNKAIDFYMKEVEQRKWYGFFNFGDFMHTYDAVRSVWRYDIGGYAWQNTELVPTLWLWISFLRTGREDIFSLAEAMARHCAEVDTYHFGEYKGHGSRHNVLHWGCACKEVRVAMAGHHRYYYYLTGDGRTGDILDDLHDAEYALERLDPLRFFYNDNFKTHARTGPDWSSLCSNWIYAWEHKKDLNCRDKMLRGISDIKKAPLRLASGSAYGFDPDTGEMIYIGEEEIGSHLAICMGSPQVWMEMIDLIDDPEWEDMISDYGEFYALSPEEKHKRSGGIVSGKGYSSPYMAATMIAFSARHRKDPNAAKKVWELLKKEWTDFGFMEQEIKKPFSIFAKTELKRVSTNFLSQLCLNTIMCLELIADSLYN